MAEKFTDTTHSGEKPSSEQGGFVEVHKRMDIDLFDLSEEIISAIRKGGPAILDVQSDVPSMDAAVSEPAPIIDITAPEKKTSQRTNSEPVVVPRAVPLESTPAPKRDRPAATVAADITPIATPDTATAFPPRAEPLVDIDREVPLTVKTAKAFGRVAMKAGKIFSKESLKAAWNNRDKFPKYSVAAVGAAAVALSFGGTAAANIKESLEHRNIMETAVNSGTVEYNHVDMNTVYMPIGGAGQGGNPPIDQMRNSGFVNGVNLRPIYYSAEIGPFVGTESMIQSEQGGADYGFDQYKQAMRMNPNANFVIPAFSEGTGVQKELAWRIYHDNGDKWPANVSMVQIGGPYHPGGIFDSKFTKAANSPILPVLDITGIDHDRALPPGAKIEYDYYADDPYAGNGNENFLTFMKNIVALGVGSHDIPNSNGAKVVVITDKEGNMHKIFVRDQDVFIQAIERAGIHVMDPDSATAAINAFFPQNIDPNSTEAPKADVRAGMAFAAKALDRQIDPSGNVKILENLVDSMPESWKQTLEDGWNGINNVMDKIAVAAANPTPENVNAAVQAVMQEIGKITADLSQNMKNPVGDVKNTLVDAAADQIQQSTGIDLHSQLQSFADMLLQPHPELQTLANKWTNPTPAAAPAVTVSIPSVVSQQIPSTAGQETDTTNSTIELRPDPATIPGTGPTIYVDKIPDMVHPADETDPVVPTPAPSSIPVRAPAPSNAENTPPPAPAPVYEAPAPVYEAPAPVHEEPAPAPAPVYEAPAPAPAPVPEYIPPAPVNNAPVYEAPAPAPAPAPVFEAPAPAPAPAPVFSFTPPAPTSIPPLELPHNSFKLPSLPSFDAPSPVVNSSVVEP